MLILYPTKSGSGSSFSALVKSGIIVGRRRFTIFSTSAVPKPLASLILKYVMFIFACSRLTISFPSSTPTVLWFYINSNGCNSMCGYVIAVCKIYFDSRYNKLTNISICCFQTVMYAGACDVAT